MTNHQRHQPAHWVGGVMYILFMPSDPLWAEDDQFLTESELFFSMDACKTVGEYATISDKLTAVAVVDDAIERMMG